MDGVRGGTQVPPRDGEGDRAQRGGGGSRPTQRPVVYTARKLRAEMSLPEGMLWKRIRGKQIGAKVRRQHPIGPYVVDFYCSAARLVVEVDGFAHDNPERVERDARRETFLVEQGYDVLPLAAAEILSDLDEALTTIGARVARPLHRACSTVPLPASGEEQ